MTIRKCLNATISLAQATSRPVWLFVALETIAAVALAVVVGLAVGRLVPGAAFDHLPSSRVLAVAPAVGASAHVLWARGPVRALRRWHGLAVRRIDERWAAER